LVKKLKGRGTIIIIDSLVHLVTQLVDEHVVMKKSVAEVHLKKLEQFH
jgi:energy-coupling factor transporter ATP-binding protein EcfA2